MVEAWSRTICSLSCALGVAFVAHLYMWDYLCPLLWAITLLCGLVGLFFGAATTLSKGKVHLPKTPSLEGHAAKTLLKDLTTLRKAFKPCQRKVVCSHSVDHTIQEILDLVTKDYILSWYEHIGQDPTTFKHLFQDDIWLLVEELVTRLRGVDWLHFLMQNIVKETSDHFHKVRQATRQDEDKERHTFELHKWLVNEEEELKFLQQVADSSLLYLLPAQYCRCTTVRHLLREVLASQIFRPGIEIICDPDYINQKLYEWLDYRETLMHKHVTTYTYAANYEDFMKMIEHCSDIEHLKQIRYNIMSEIMQATTIQNLKRAKGIDTDKELAPKGTTKGHLLKARNLRRYLNQLTIAKSSSERRMHLLGGIDYKSYTETTDDSPPYLPGQKVLSFAVVMQTAAGRVYLEKYLKKTGMESLIKFWTAVDHMRHMSQLASSHQYAGEIHHQHLVGASSVVRSHLDRNIIRNAEAFLLGNMGPEGFWEAQSQIYQELEEHHYPSFILSDVYHHYLCSLESEGDSVSRQLTAELTGPSPVKVRKGSSQDKLTTERIVQHSMYAQAKLAHLDDRILNKSQALQALQKSPRAEAKMVKLQEELAEELESLQTGRRELEFHIDRTDLWAVNVGHWKAHIYNAEVVQEEEKMVPYFVVVVDLPSSISMQAAGTGGTHGWVVSRKLEDFHALHHTLVQIQPSVKKLNLPSVGKFRIKSLDTAFLNSSKSTLQDFLNVVLEDESLAQSEAAFSFFSPSPEHLKQASSLHKSGSKFSLVNFLKRNKEDSDSEDDLLFEDDVDSCKEEQQGDRVTEPLYQLIGEVFELRGLFRWLRRTLMVFVRVTFGRSTNRQLKEMVSWVTSETMINFYLTSFRDAYWPDGQLADKAPPRTDAQKLQMRRSAKEKMLSNIPDAVKNLVGEHNARHGTVKVFETFQDIRLNKHLFYVILELALMEIFPELQQHRNALRLREDTQAEADTAAALGCPEAKGGYTG